LTQLVSDYGYLALAVGCLLEGETIVLLAGFAVHRGQLSWGHVVLIATVFSFVGDQFWFQIGRHFGDRLMGRFPSIASRRPWLQKRVFAHPDLIVLGVRFMVGLRTVGPILMGTGFVRPLRFFWLNLLGAVIWVQTIVSAGYFFGAGAAFAARVESGRGGGFLTLLVLGLLVHAAPKAGRYSG
jgi:membrane protein DedA with SNARE-associated domain